MSVCSNRFQTCERGNIALLTAGVMLPLVMLSAGGIELAERNKITHNLQNSTDAAVLAAFHTPSGRWSDAQRRAKLFFEVNMAQKKRLEHVQTKLQRKRFKTKLFLTYTARTEIKSLFGNFNPWAGQELVITSTAVYNHKTQRGPRLIPNETSAGVSLGNSVNADR